MFPSKVDIECHSRNFHEKNNPRCKICFKLFAHSIYLTNHLKNEHSDHSSLISCQQCSRVFEQESKRIQHICRPAYQEIRCEFCSNLLTSVRKYITHVNTEHLDRIAGLWNKCKDCSIFFPSESELKHHNCKIKRPQLNCVLCGSTFPAAKGLTHHIKANHPNENPNVIECSLCFKQFDSKEMFGVHDYEEHKVKKILPPCTVCSKQFSSQIKFATHDCNRRIKCSHCDVTYLKKRYLRNHIASRHPEFFTNRIDCLFCSEKFTSTPLFIGHANREHLSSVENFWLQCGQCSSHFPSEKTLEKHNCCKQKKENELKTKENKIKPKENKIRKRVNCSKCDASYIRAHNLKIHIERHHSDSSEDTVKCKFCNLEFKKRWVHLYHMHAR